MDCEVRKVEDTHASVSVLSKNLAERREVFIPGNLNAVLNRDFKVMKKSFCSVRIFFNRPEELFRSANLFIPL